VCADTTHTLACVFTFHLKHEACFIIVRQQRP